MAKLKTDVTKHVKNEVQQACKVQGVTVAQYIREAVNEQLKRVRK